MAVPHDDQDYGASYIELEESAGAGVHSTSAAAPATVYSEPLGLGAYAGGVP